MCPVISEDLVGEVRGEEVRRYRLANASGMTVSILNYGGIVQSVEFPDRNGKFANVVLGFETLDEYVRYNPAPSVANPQGVGAYFGALIGRYANRLAGGRFEVDGQSFQVPVNDGPNALHGGVTGFDQKVWRPTVEDGASAVGVRLEYVSPAGEMGFPGTLSTVASYRLDDGNRLALTLEATTDAATVVNLTNHTYWNLGGEPLRPVYDTVLLINGSSFTPVDDHLVPTGQVAPVAGTPLDFLKPAAIGDRVRYGDQQLRAGRGYDHNWALDQTSPRSLVLAATAVDPVTGRGLNVRTTQPGLQFYSGNFLNGGTFGHGGHSYRQADGFALEAQGFPDAPNHPEFPATTLRPGERYKETIVFELFCQS